MSALLYELFKTNQEVCPQKSPTVCALTATTHEEKIGELEHQIGENILATLQVILKPGRFPEKKL